jgi:hypothetical protein
LVFNELHIVHEFGKQFGLPSQLMVKLRFGQNV